MPAGSEIYLESELAGNGDKVPSPAHRASQKAKEGSPSLSIRAWFYSYSSIAW